MRIVTGHNPDWDKAFHDMVRGVVYQHLMLRLKPVLDPVYASLDKIEQDCFEIERLLRRPGRGGIQGDAAALQVVVKDRSSTLEAGEDARRTTRRLLSGALDHELAGRMSPVPANAERLTTSAPDGRSAQFRGAR